MRGKLLKSYEKYGSKRSHKNTVKKGEHLKIQEKEMWYEIDHDCRLLF